MTEKTKTCPCDNPECTLPLGRCCCCGQPCIATGPNNEVCGQCIVAVRALYDLECRTTASPDQPGPNPDGPGWFLVDECEDDSGLIVRDDGQDIFEDDEAAAAHVAARLTGDVEKDDNTPSLTPEAAENIRRALAVALPEMPTTVAVARLLDVHADMLMQKASRPLLLSDRARISQALRELARRERRAASETSDPSVWAQLEHQAAHADTLAAEIQSASSVTILE